MFVPIAPSPKPCADIRKDFSSFAEKTRSICFLQAESFEDALTERRLLAEHADEVPASFVSLSSFNIAEEFNKTFGDVLLFRGASSDNGIGIEPCARLLYPGTRSSM
jgi:hypothetical protein